MEETVEGAFAWKPPARRHILRLPLPEKSLADRILVKLVALATRGQVRAMHGTEHILPDCDPFILVANHSTVRDTVVMPAMLMLQRRGRPVHYLADWNFRLYPGVGLLYDAAEVITVTRKSVPIPLLNKLKRFYDDPIPSIERARRHLLNGRSVGFFPEGTINRDPARLLVGRSGAARLSLETGVPVVPMGVRFPEAPADQSRAGPMEAFIGAPLVPSKVDATPAPYSAVRDWHATLMREIGRLSGKEWHRGAWS